LHLKLTNDFGCAEILEHAYPSIVPELSATTISCNYSKGEIDKEKKKSNI